MDQDSKVMKKIGQLIEDSGQFVDQYDLLEHKYLQFCQFIRHHSQFLQQYARCNKLRETLQKA